MSKIKVTKKEMLRGYKNIIEVGYCDLAYLLYYTNPNFYTCGVYGWNADIYQINYNTIIVTGYRAFGNIKTNYKINNKYNEKARKICNNFKLSLEQQKKQLEKLLEKFIKEVLQESEG